MTSRRSFVKHGITLAAGTAITSVFGNDLHRNFTEKQQDKGLKLRFLLASDGHYGQPGTDYTSTHNNIIKWINEEHDTQKIDLSVFNGDIVHDQPQLLKVVKDKYFSQLKMPFYTVPGNHDHATSAQWKQVFGYNFNYSFEKGDIAFVLANTSNERGEYVCPDINFLNAEFQKYRSKEIVFVVLHIPPNQWLQEETHFTKCDEVINLMHSYNNIKAVFHGHDHNLDSVRYSGKLPHFFDSHYGGSWGTNYYGYRIVEVGLDNSINTFQKNPALNPLINKNKLTSLS